MAKAISEFDRGALAVFDLMALLRGQLQDFARELRRTWPWDSVSWDLECGADEDSGHANTAIDLWLELKVDLERTVCWSLDLSQDDHGWEIGTQVEIYGMSDDEAADPPIIEADSRQFDSFAPARDQAPDLLQQLFATRKDVEAFLDATDH